MYRIILTVFLMALSMALGAVFFPIEKVVEVPAAPTLGSINKDLDSIGEDIKQINDDMEEYTRKAIEKHCEEEMKKDEPFGPPAPPEILKVPEPTPKPIKTPVGAKPGTKFTVFKVELEVVPRNPENYQFAKDRIRQLSNIAIAIPSIKSVEAKSIKGKPKGSDEFIDARPQGPGSTESAAHEVGLVPLRSEQ